MPEADAPSSGSQTATDPLDSPARFRFLRQGEEESDYAPKSFSGASERIQE